MKRSSSSITVFAAFVSLLAANFLVSPVGSTIAHADAKQFYYQRYTENRFNELTTHEAVVAKTVDARINYNDANDKRTFKQRYYVDSTFATGPNAPVLFHICGEATCTGREIGGATLEWAKKLGAHRVALEHRYYGKSQPFAKLSSENMKFLTTEFALMDLAAFHDFAAKTLSFKGKWIVLGGSYPGSLAAYARLKFPNLFVGALASSGPVQAKANFEEYDLTVARVAGPECAAAMKKVVKQVEDSLTDDKRLLQIKKTFKSEEVKDPVDFLYVIADMGAIAIQYGARDKFCSALLSSGDTLTNYAQVGLQLFTAFGITPLQDSFQGAESENPDDYFLSFGMRQWLYQSCTEYGYWQNAYHDPEITVRSTKINPAYHDSVCKRMFGVDHGVDTSKINKNYYEPLLDPSTSQILFTNGSNDPWANLSITKELRNNTNPNTVAFTIQGAAHADDLGTSKATDSSSLKDARATFSDLAIGWLK